ncbi:sugar phosphate isomerase/epimerase family protein [Pedobacter mucosus]|uniref:sugar phosphate isomerase/epimerase family protein n=1 Tax=Pedobacter mucosus TaxID=2895286 RepID=UPI001EE480C6|nr:TIM barrel protein [Pedobacter mucosus]UKT64815.1 sugar phosphate isomerase/epimerase [Pedobacter mucosus]
MKIKTKLALLLLSSVLFSFVPIKKTYIPLGIVAPIEKDSIIFASGFKIFGESVGRMISPSLSEEKFQQNLELIKKAKCELYMCNVMFPAEMKIAGPDVNEQVVLKYADALFSRAAQAKVSLIVLGSGTARRLPENYDIKKAQRDFVILCKKLALLAEKSHVKIVLENLQTKETNFLTSVKSAAEVVRLVNHPNFRLNADIFHMRREGESPQSIIDAADVLIHCEIAENEERTLPGSKGDDFKPYLMALKKANYKGKIFIEAGTNYTPSQFALSFNFLTKQIEAVYAD